MKNLSFLIISFALLGLISCSEEKFNLWNDPETHLAFKHVKDDSVSRHTFVYDIADVQRDTVIFEVYTSGFLSDKDRIFEFEQLDPRDSENSKPIAGVHFVKFDAPEVSNYFVIKAGTAKTKVPIIMLRDKSLKESQFELRVKIKKNENFTLGVERDLEKRLIFADIISRPKGWTINHEKYYFGPYGFEKHRFMISVTPGVKIDEDFFKAFDSDYPLAGYYADYYTAKLKEENDRRKADGLDVLREAPKEGQTIGDEIYFR